MKESLHSLYLGSPHEPQLEDVHMASALQRFVPGVIGKVVLFVLLEEVAGVHLVAVLHQTLWGQIRKAVISSIQTRKKL